MNLFIDDVIEPHQVGFKDVEWYIARSFDEAIAYITVHKPQMIAFDHDLSYFPSEKSGLDVAKWLIEWDMAHPDRGYITEGFTFSSHSANPDGKRNILMLLEGYYNHKFRSVA